MTSHYRTVAEAIAALAGAPAEAPPLSKLAARAELSAAHFQRVFTEYVGVSPKRFTQALLLDRAEAELAGGAGVLAAATGAGLSGPGRLHDLSVSLRAMTPGELGSGGERLRIEWAVGETLFGPAVVATTERGVCALSFVDEGAEPTEPLRRRFPRAALVERAGTGAEALDALRRASRAQGPLALHVRGTPFQVRVWRALLAIPAGATPSYGTLAEQLGHPRGARAVAGAVAANPIAVLIPCHRVLRKHGALGGYRWGLERKRALLALEHS